MRERNVGSKNREPSKAAERAWGKGGEWEKKIKTMNKHTTKTNSGHKKVIAHI